MMVLKDIHTHLFPRVKGSAIINTLPTSFVPEEGMWYSVGFHPWYLKEEFSRMDWELFEEAVVHPQVLSVGEVGLDKLAQAPLTWQMEVFERQVLYAEHVQKPVIIHLVKAVDQLWKIKQQLRPTVPWIIHGFRGKVQQADSLVRHGFYLSCGEKFQEEALKIIPSDRLFLETDENDLPIEKLYERVATVRGCSVEEIMECIGKNVCAVFFKH